MTLGCGLLNYEILVNDRCGAPRVSRVTDFVERIEFTRVLDGPGAATITLGTGCCDELRKIASLRHTLMIVRDGVAQWDGVILVKEDGGTRRTESGRATTSERRVGIDVATLYAFTYETWLDVRAVRTAYKYDSIDPIVYLEEIIRAGLEPDDPCLLEYLDFRPGVEPTEIAIEPYESSVGDELREWGKEGVDYTSIGRRLVVFPADTTLGAVGPFRDEHFLTVPRILEQGGDFTSRAIVKANGHVRSAGSIDPYYGLVERISENDRATTSTGAFNSAKARLGGLGGRVPIYIVLDSDTYLAPETPVELEELWPGIKVDIQLLERCTEIYQSFKLAGTRVVVDNEGEKVALTLIPLEDAFAEGDDSGLPEGIDDTGLPLPVDPPEEITEPTEPPELAPL